MNVLVTGGLGYIGSHTVVSLIEHNHKVVIVDNLVNSSEEVLKALNTLTDQTLAFYPIDVRDEVALNEVFKNHTLDAIIHFAAYKAVGESVAKPLKYYDNNLRSLISVLHLAEVYQIKKIIFSSSCTVYGNQPSPLKESLPLLPPMNPYGATKQMGERILADFIRQNDVMQGVILRYFNPIGAHPSGLIGEGPQEIPNNLMPYVLDVALKNKPYVSIFGKDYPTPDGTAIRDYIHVMDLAHAHVLAMEKSVETLDIMNVGTGQGYSVLDIVEGFKRVNQVEVPYQFTARRAGDLAITYADPEECYRKIGFKTSCTLDDMLRDCWNFAQCSLVKETT